MEQMMDLLLAKVKEYHEEIMAGMKAGHEEMVKMKFHHEEMMETMRADREETKAYPDK
jgi:hypothetical protein